MYLLEYMNNEKSDLFSIKKTLLKCIFRIYLFFFWTKSRLFPTEMFPYVVYKSSTNLEFVFISYV